MESGVGTFTGATFCNGQYTKQFNYTSDYCYDSMGNILEKISTSYRLDEAYKTGYNQNYTLRYNNKNDSCDPDDEESGYLGDNKIHTVNEIFSDTDNFYNSVERDVTHTFSYDDNGNTESQLVEGTDIHNGEKDLGIATKRNLIWRQRDNLSVSADNNALTHYFYDGNNDRVLKMSDSYNRIFVNGELSADSTKTKLNYSIYVNPYLVLRPDGHYTKHYFIDSERIVSKIGNPDNYMNNFLAAPLPQKGMMEDYIVDNIKKLRGDKNENDIRLDPDNDITIENESQTDPIDIGLTNGSMATESMQYYFANDHLGSASLITNADGMLIQNLQYTPFGETFVDMRSGDFATPYRFTGKEQDCETGLYYYGARYYDSRLGRFLSVDPLASKFPSYSPYAYTFNNPIRFTDPTGMEPEPPGGVWGGLRQRWNDFKNDVFGGSDGPSFGEFLSTTTRAIGEWAGFYSEVGRNIVDEVPIAGEALSAYEGDYAGIVVGAIPGGKKVEKAIKHLRNGDDIIARSFKEADDILFGAFPDAKKIKGAGDKSKEKMMSQQRQFIGVDPNGKFHKDFKKNENGVLFGHENLPDGHPHKTIPHINVKTPDGKKATIYIQDKL